jgi:hypothetical protein
MGSTDAGLGTAYRTAPGNPVSTAHLNLYWELQRFFCCECSFAAAKNYASTDARNETIAAMVTASWNEAYLTDDANASSTAHFNYAPSTAFGTALVTAAGSEQN